MKAINFVAILTDYVSHGFAWNNIEKTLLLHKRTICLHYEQVNKEQVRLIPIERIGLINTVKVKYCRVAV